jgi:hypothetical protein
MKLIPKNNQNRVKSPNPISNLDSISILHDFQLEEGLLAPYNLLSPIKDLPNALVNTFPHRRLWNPLATVASPIGSLPRPAYWMRSTTGVPWSFRTHVLAGRVTPSPVAIVQDRRTRHAIARPSRCLPKTQLTQVKKPLHPSPFWAIPRHKPFTGAPPSPCADESTVAMAAAVFCFTPPPPFMRLSPHRTSPKQWLWLEVRKTFRWIESGP